MSVVELVFFWQFGAGHRLIFLRKDLLNSLPHKLTSEPIDDYAKNGGPEEV